MDVGVETIATQLAWLLVGASLLCMLAGRLKIPYAGALVLGGVAASRLGLASLPPFDPHLVLLIFLPPLLFDAAFRLDSRELGPLARPLLLLALPGTILTALVVGLVLVALLGQPLLVGLIFGGVVAATDPVAVVAVFRRLHVPSRLAVVLEAESLLNDAVAITLYEALVRLAMTGSASLGDAALVFVWRLGAGVAVGAAAGLVVSQLTRLTDDHLTQMSLSTALAFGSYLAGEALGASGPMACIAAGALHGSYGRAIGMSPRTRQLLDDTWEYLGFFANGLLFLMVGFSAGLASIGEAPGPVAAAILAVLIARLALIGVASLLPPGQQPGQSTAERVVLIWGGLRGALTVTLALALPAEAPGRALITTMAVGVVLFTLVVQGLTLPLLVSRLGLAGRPAPE